MPRRARRRTFQFAAILAAGVVAGLPLLPVAAAEAEGAGVGRLRQAASAVPPEISFSRSGLGLLTCNSRPSDHDLVVPAGTTVRFVNDLGGDATLRIDGQEATGVARGESSEVLFRRGTVRIQLVPSCGLSLSSAFEAVAVTVAAPGDATSRPPSRAPVPPVPPSGRSSTGAAGGRDSGNSPEADRDREDGSSSGQSASAAPSGAPAGAGATPAEGGTGDGLGALGDQGAAAEPLSPAAASGEEGPNGLLVIIAVVCIVGVSTGAIRAIFALRATRTRAA